MWTRAVVHVTTNRRVRLKAQRKISKKSSGGKSLLSEKEFTSSSGESAAVHSVQSDLLSFSDRAGMSDDDHAVVRTVETLSVVGSDAWISTQEKEVWSSGGIPSR